MSVFEGLKDLAPLVTAATAIYIANMWRRQTTGKRQIEVAEQALTLFYEARDAISSIRFLGAIETEYEAGERNERDTDAQYEARKHASVVFSRYRAHFELFAKIQTMRYQFHTLFGKSVPDPFADLQSTVNQILLAARMLAHLWAKPHEHEFRTQLQADHHFEEVSRYEAIFWEHADTDEIAAKVNAIVQQMEDTCRPILSPPPWYQGVLRVASSFKIPG